MNINVIEEQNRSLPQYGYGTDALDDLNETGSQPLDSLFDKFSVRVIFFILYTIVFCLCFFGNMAVILVVTLHWRMRSITKFMLANLAFANFCVSVFCIWQNFSTLFSSWIFGSILCKMYHYINSLSHTASILILVVICVERYLAILHPFKCRQILTMARLRVAIVCVWIISAILCSPRLYFFNTMTVTFDNGNETTSETLCVPQRTLYNSHFVDMVNFFVLFLLPLLVISVLYTKVGLFLWKNSVIDPPKMPVVTEFSPNNSHSVSVSVSVSEYSSNMSSSSNSDPYVMTCDCENHNHNHNHIQNHSHNQKYPRRQSHKGHFVCCRGPRPKSRSASDVQIQHQHQIQHQCTTTTINECSLQRMSSRSNSRSISRSLCGTSRRRRPKSKYSSPTEPSSPNSNPNINLDHIRINIDEPTKDIIQLNNSTAVKLLSNNNSISSPPNSTASQSLATSPSVEFYRVHFLSGKNNNTNMNTNTNKPKDFDCSGSLVDSVFEPQVKFNCPQVQSKNNKKKNSSSSIISQLQLLRRTFNSTTSIPQLRKCRSRIHNNDNDQDINHDEDEADCFSLRRLKCFPGLRKGTGIDGSNNKSRSRSRGLCRCRSKNHKVDKNLRQLASHIQRAKSKNSMNNKTRTRQCSHRSKSRSSSSRRRDIKNGGVTVLRVNIVENNAKNCSSNQQVNNPMAMSMSRSMSKSKLQQKTKSKSRSRHESSTYDSADSDTNTNTNLNEQNIKNMNLEEHEKFLGDYPIEKLSTTCNPNPNEFNNIPLTTMMFNLGSGNGAGAGSGGCRGHELREDSFSGDGSPPSLPISHTSTAALIRMNRQRFTQSFCRKRRDKMLKPRRQVIRMLITIVITFAICNFPYHLRKMFQNWWSSYDFLSNFSLLISPLTFLLMYLNCAINPILLFFSNSFRSSFKDLIHCRLKKPYQM